MSCAEFVLHGLPSGAASDHADGAPQPIAASACEDSFIILVRVDPKPVEDVTFVVAEDSVGLVHPGAPYLADGLQVQRRMEWILAEEFELFIGVFLNIRRKGAVKFPEFVRGVGEKRHGLRLRALFIHRPKLAGANIGLDLFYNVSFR